MTAILFAFSLAFSAIQGFAGDDDQPSLTAATGGDDPDNAPAPSPPGESVALATGTPAAADPATPAPPPALPTETTDATDLAAGPLTVCLDVGHGGHDWGYTRTEADGSGVVAMEKDLVLELSLEIEQRLQVNGINVVLTRRGDTIVNVLGEDVNGDGEMAEDVDGSGFIDSWDDIQNNLDELQARVNVCNAAGADLILSVHINGAENLFLQGYEAWWAEGRPFSDQSQWLAQRIVQEFGAEFDAAGFAVESRGAADDTAVDIPPEDQGTFRHYVVLSPDVPDRSFIGSTMPGAVIESLFLSNDNDWDVLTDPAGNEAIVDAYVNTILAYFEEHPEPINNKPEPGDPILRWLPDENVDADEEANVAVRAPGGAARTDGETVATPDATAETAMTALSPEATRTGPAPTPRPPLPEIPATGETYVVNQGNSERDEIALTFDAGEDLGYTEGILDLLAERDIKASFGITGAWAEENPDMVIRMVDEGHMIINHTYSHTSFTGFSTPWNPEDPGSEFRINEIQRTQQIIFDIAGYDTVPYFRPPYGDLGPQSRQDIATAGYDITVMWTVDSLGWKPGETPAQVAERSIRGAAPGGILLFHVGAKSQDFPALPAILDELEAAGYDFVTVEELLQPAE